MSFLLDTASCTQAWLLSLAMVHRAHAVQMHVLEEETGAAVETSQQLQCQRANLVATLDVLRAMEGVAQAQSALQGLLPCGDSMAADYAGAIDVLEVLQGVLDDELLLSLECFK